MRYYKFNRDRSFVAELFKYRKSSRKQMYMLNTNRTRLLDSCYLESQTWGALHKAWKGYVIAKNKSIIEMNEIEKMYHYAEVIQKLQGELGLPISSFPDLGLVPEGYRYENSDDS